MPITCYHSSESVAISGVFIKTKIVVKRSILHSGQMKVQYKTYNFPWLLKFAEKFNLSHWFFSWNYDLRLKLSRQFFSCQYLHSRWLCQISSWICICIDLDFQLNTIQAEKKYHDPFLLVQFLLRSLKITPFTYHPPPPPSPALHF